MRWLCGVGVLLLGGQALAQPVAGEPPIVAPEPSIDPPPVAADAPAPALPPPPCAPAPAPDRSDQELKRLIKEALAEQAAEQKRKRLEKSIRNHDGGYLRVGFNLGFISDSARQGAVKAESSGFGGFLDAAFGGSLSESLVVGAALHSLGAFSATTELDGQNLDRQHSTFVQVVGVLLDYYPDPRRGLHIGMTVGSGSADIVVNADEETSSGVGLAMRLGYDFWVGEQWSVGPALGLLFVAGASDELGNHRAVAPTLTLTALYH
jgi:hypothetical protein